MKKSHSYKDLTLALIAIFVVSFFIRIIWVFHLAPDFPNALGGANWLLNPSIEPITQGGIVSPDFNQVYDPNARMLAEGKGFSNLDGSPTAYVGPGYSFFLSIIYKTFGINLDTVRIFQIFLDSISACMIALVCFLLRSNHQESVLTGVLYAIHPFIFYQTGLLISESLFTFLLIAYFLFLFLGIKSKDNHLIFLILCGIFLGLASLTRPNGIILILTLPILVILFKEFRQKEYIYSFMVISTGLVLVVGPWILRNYIIFDQFIPISSIVFNTVEDTTGPASGLLDLIYKKFYVAFTDINYLINVYLLAPLKIWAQTGSKAYDFYLSLISYPMIIISLYGLFTAIKNDNQKMSTLLFISVMIFVFGLIFFTKNMLTRYVVPIMPIILIFVSIAFSKLYYLIKKTQNESLN